MSRLDVHPSYTQVLPNWLPEVAHFPVSCHIDQRKPCCSLRCLCDQHSSRLSVHEDGVITSHIFVHQGLFLIAYLQMLFVPNLSWSGGLAGAFQ
jgi:hypothetical protein